MLRDRVAVQSLRNCDRRCIDVDDVGVIALEERANLHRADFVSGGHRDECKIQNACKKPANQFCILHFEFCIHSSNVNDAHKLSQSAFDVAGAGIICTDLIIHTPRFGSLNDTRPDASDRMRMRSDGSSRCMATTIASRSGFDSYNTRTSIASPVTFSGTISYRNPRGLSNTVFPSPATSSDFAQRE